MKGIGIDTGGTYTDAVIYDFETGRVLTEAKALTTHHDLKIGISQVLRMMPEDLLRECSQAALSTTLATNACVENLGGRGKIIFLGVSRKVFMQTFRSYGFLSLDDVMLVDCRLLPDPDASQEPDWEALRDSLPAFLKDCDCVSIVQLYAAEHGGACERHVRDLIREYPQFQNMPVILGCTLFSDRNAIRRGAGSLLNARLVPVVYAFMTAIREVFASLALDVPITIIRSDGSQMTESFAAERPVETLLCGPAASVIGACTLSDAANAVVVDMGGTTTDLAIVKNHQVLRADGGIRVGEWKTFVKGLYVDTFGLGGDTRIYYDRGGKVLLGKNRVKPLCSLAAECPSVLDSLRELDRSGRINVNPLHEFFVLLKDAESETSGNMSRGELALCRLLKSGPLSYEACCTAMGEDVYTADFSKLESSRIILRCGLTPTDFMHLKGDFNGYCTEASLYAARFFTRSSQAETVEDLTVKAYDLVTERLYKNLVRVLLTTECPSLSHTPFDEQMNELIDYAYRQASSKRRRTDFFPRIFETRAGLIGVGAPTHIFLPRVAAMLHTQAVLPDHASVANAVGAISGQVIAVTEVTLHPLAGEQYGSAAVISRDSRRTFPSRSKALAYARKEGKRIAAEQARKQGARGPLTIREELIRSDAGTGYGRIWLGDTLRFTASGSALR